MAHDFYNLQDRVTRHHAPLFQGSMDTGNHARYNAVSGRLVYGAKQQNLRQSDLIVQQ